MTYSPKPAPSSVPDNIRDYIEQELVAISRELQETVAVDLRPVHAEPTRPRDGMIIYADGTDFDPGSGEGVYARENGSWVKL